MLVTPEYCVTMARYNAWQNRQLRAVVENMDDADLRKDHGAFFGSIFATLNHVLWGDALWLSRFSGRAAPAGGIAESPELTPTLAVWSADRFRLDGQLLLWAEKLKALDLMGEETWMSGALGREVSLPKSLCVMHMFNHQTHHRGQIHAMLTALGQQAPVSDLFAMPQEGPWP